MYNSNGDWTKAHEQYRALMAQTANSRDFDIILRLPDYLAQFISDVLSHYESGHDPQDLGEAQELLEKLKRLKSDTLDLVMLQARIYKAQNQVDKAAQLIETNANRPTLTDAQRSGPGQARRGPGAIRPGRTALPATDGAVRACPESACAGHVPGPSRQDQGGTRRVRATLGGKHQPRGTRSKHPGGAVFRWWPA